MAIFFLERSLMEYIYAFDLAMSRTGIAIFTKEGKIVKTCSVATNKKDTHGKRLATIADFILELVKEYPAKEVVLERAFNRFNTSTAVLYRVHGMVQYLFHDKVQYYYAPKEIKAKIISGKATKLQVRETIEKVYGDIGFENEDESDACAVGLTFFIANEIINWV